jgi:hypothetical protein
MKPAVVCLYVWDAFLEGGLAKGSHGEEVLGCETKETQEERRALEGKGPPVTVTDPATGKAETVLLPRYSDAAAAGPLWKPLLQQMVELATKRGVEKQLAFGVVTDVEPAPEASAFFKGIQPGIPWLRRGHMRIKDIGGQPLICQIGPSYNTWGYDAKPGERLYGWNGREWAYPGLSVHFPRSFRDYYSRCRFRMVGECNIIGAQRGFGGLGADFWTVLKNKRGVRAATLAARYPKSSWRNLNIETSMLAPGKAGAIATARYEMMREGLQECEARIIIEKAVIEKKISGELAARAQAVLDERLAAMVDGMGKGWCYDGHWETQRSEFPKFVDGGWQERSGKLFDAAAEVAKLADPESQKARPSPSAGAAPARRPPASAR